MQYNIRYNNSVTSWSGVNKKQELAPSENRNFGPPPLDFGAIAYLSRAFVSNRLRLLIGRDFAQLPQLEIIAIASPRGLPQMLQQPWDWGLEKNLVKNWKRTKLLEIAWNGDKMDWIFLTNIFFYLCLTKICQKIKIDRNCELIKNIFENVWPTFYPWSFPSLLALVGVTIEKG